MALMRGQKRRSQSHCVTYVRARHCKGLHLIISHQAPIPGLNALSPKQAPPRLKHASSAFFPAALRLLAQQKSGSSMCSAALRPSGFRRVWPRFVGRRQPGDWLSAA